MGGTSCFAEDTPLLYRELAPAGIIEPMNLISILRQRQLEWLLAFISLTGGAAALGAAWTMESVRGWYRTLRKPHLNPPDRVFGPVWTVLYLQMAISAWLVLRGMSKRPERQPLGQAALAAWGVQLALNVAWSGVFFAQQRITGGLYVIGALWAAIAICAALASRVTRLAGLLLLPYLAWVSFASYLNWRVRQLNPGR